MVTARALLFGRSFCVGVALFAAVGAASAQQGNGVGSQFELIFWQSVSGSEDRSQLEAYLAQYPAGTFAALARAKITAIDRRDAQSRGVMAAPAPVAPTMAAPIGGAAVVAVSSLSTAGNAAAAMPAVASAPVAVATPAAISTATPAAAPSLAEQLRGLGQSQGIGAAAAPAMALPPRPQLSGLSDVALPDHFCSAAERNGFYDSVFTPSRDLAEQNNKATIAHMQKLRQMYDELALSRNPAAQNAIAGEAKDYEAVASDAYSKSAAYEGLFTRMMAVPISKCS